MFLLVKRWAAESAPHAKKSFMFYKMLRKFFKPILEPSSCLFTLLPNPWDPSVTTRLRSANKFPRLPNEKLSDIYFLCSLSVAICIIIQTSILVFCFYFFSFLWLYPYICCILYCDSFGLYYCMYLICYLVLWPPDWINATTTTTFQLNYR